MYIGAIMPFMDKRIDSKSGVYIAEIRKFVAHRDNEERMPVTQWRHMTNNKIAMGLDECETNVSFHILFINFSCEAPIAICLMWRILLGKVCLVCARKISYDNENTNTHLSCRRKLSGWDSYIGSRLSNIHKSTYYYAEWLKWQAVLRRCDCVETN